MKAIDLGRIVTSGLTLDGLRGEPLDGFITSVDTSDASLLDKAAVVSWRWTDDVKKHSSVINDTLLAIIDQALRYEFLYIFIDFITIDQTSDSLTASLIEYSNLYHTLPVLLAYQFRLTDEHLALGFASGLTAGDEYVATRQAMRRAWISLEISRFLRREKRIGMRLRDLFQFDNTGTPAQNYALACEIVKDLIPGYIVESQQEQLPPFPIRDHLKTMKGLGQLRIEADGYVMRSIVNAYTPTEMLADGVTDLAENCEFKSDLLIVAALDCTDKPLLRQLVLDRFSSLKLKRPCSALLLIALAVISPGKQRTQANIDDFRRQLHAPIGLASQLKHGTISSKFNNNATGFWLQYRTIRVYVSSCNGDIRANLTVGNESIESDFCHLLDKICEIGEMSSDDSHCIMSHAEQGCDDWDQHYDCGIANAYIVAFY